MKIYRAYPIDSHGGHIARPPKEFAADNDEAAMHAARQYLNGHDIEVWELERRVGLLKRDGA